MRRWILAATAIAVAVAAVLGERAIRTEVKRARVENVEEKCRRASRLFPELGCEQLIFGGTTLEKASLRVSENWQDSFLNNPTDYRHAYVPAELTLGSATIGNVGLRYAGSSRFRLFLRAPTVAMPSLVVDTNHFKRKNQFAGVRKLYFRSLTSDQSLIREKLALDWLGRFGIATPLSRYVDLSFNNGPPRLYLLTERPSTEMQTRLNVTSGPPRKYSEEFLSRRSLAMMGKSIDTRYLARYVVLSLLLGDVEGFFNYANFTLYPTKTGKIIVPTDLDRTFYTECVWLEEVGAGKALQTDRRALRNLLAVTEAVGPDLKAEILSFVQEMEARHYDEDAFKKAIADLYEALGERLPKEEKLHFARQFQDLYSCGTRLVAALKPKFTMAEGAQ